jgi:hypothetical protein
MQLLTLANRPAEGLLFDRKKTMISHFVDKPAAEVDRTGNMGNRGPVGQQEDNPAAFCQLRSDGSRPLPPGIERTVLSPGLSCGSRGTPWHCRLDQRPKPLGTEGQLRHCNAPGP